MSQSYRFDELTGQRVGHNKTVAFSAPPAKNDVPFTRDIKLKSINAEKTLGILMEVHGMIDT